MEDCHSTDDSCMIAGTDSKCAFYGVYDGHNGQQAAIFVAAVRIEVLPLQHQLITSFHRIV